MRKMCWRHLRLLFLQVKLYGGNVATTTTGKPLSPLEATWARVVPFALEWFLINRDVSASLMIIRAASFRDDALIPDYYY